MLLAWRSDLLRGQRARGARASNLSIKDKFEEVAKEWSALAVWAELKRTSPSTAPEVDTREANRIWTS